MLASLDEKLKFKRENRTVDIVKRVGVLTADRVHLLNHPAENPVTIFNPSIIVDNQDLKIYGRIVLGYFTYASAVLELTVPLNELSDISRGHYCGRIIIRPDNKYDIWGVEDPRACVVRGKKTITYCGRTINYFSPVRVERALPLVAVHDGDGWKKAFVLRFSVQNTVSDKDCFIAEVNGLKIFHRIHTLNNEYYCVMNELPSDVLDREEFTEVHASKTNILLEPADFEEKIGWGSPIVEVEGEYLLLLHGVDRSNKWYRVFAALMNKDARITAVTRTYIMEPRENYEVYGDRPFTVFPCGLCKIEDRLLVSYGAADFAIGIGEINLDELMSMLDSNRIE